MNINRRDKEKEAGIIAEAMNTRCPPGDLYSSTRAMTFLGSPETEAEVSAINSRTSLQTLWHGLDSVTFI